MKKILISNIDELIKTLNSFPNNFAYRGQSNENWGLKTSIERHINNTEKIKIFEDHSIDTFKNSLRIYSEKDHQPNSKLAWLAFMQHYGVPTRLLDFSTSPYIALYFAIESGSLSENECFSLFSIDYANLIKKSCAYVVSVNSNFRKYGDNFFSQCEVAFEEIIDKNSYDVLWFVDPKYLNSRMEKQGGTFLMSGSFNKTIDELLELDIYKDVSMTNILIPKNLFTNIYALLRKMNIGPKSIYGDLFGLAKHIQLEFKVYGS